MPKKEFTQNDTVRLMHENAAFCLNAIADHIEKFEHDREAIIKLLRDNADELAAQAIVVGLRDSL